MKAIKVFSESICYLKKDLTAHLKNVDLKADENIHWMLTVPAIWDDGAKQFMREAAEQVNHDKAYTFSC